MSPRQDDPNIPNDERLWRRILEAWLHKEPNGVVRPSSVAFIDRLSHELSVHIARLTYSELVLRSRPTDSIAEITAAVPRANHHAVCSDPIRNDPVLDDDPSHALICPELGRGISQRKTDARKMAGSARFAVLRDPAATNLLKLPAAQAPQLSAMHRPRHWVVKHCAWVVTLARKIFSGISR
jgi:hypothetical protein